MDTPNGQDKSMKKIVIAAIISICISSILPIISIVLYKDVNDRIYYELYEKNNLDGIKLRLFDVELQLKSIPIKASCDLKFSSSDFGTIHTSTGTYLISVVSIDEHRTGSRLSLKIGNITSATGSNFTTYIRVEGKDTDKPTNIEKKFSDNLEPGKWTLVAIDIPELSPNQLKDDFSVRLSVDGMSLFVPR